MRQALIMHPASRCDAVTSIAVDVARKHAGGLALRYSVHGAIDGLFLPAALPSARADELWRHTCFEAFVGEVSGSVYCEFNFAPSTLWAAYRFTGYRQGMSAIEIVHPRIEVRTAGASLEINAQVVLDGVSGFAADSPWQIGLAAVIEEQGGRLSYWALAHAPGRPDFHHSDCFALELAAPSRA